MHCSAVVPSEYEILAELGRGTSGVVYRARRRDLDRVIALKLPRVESPSEAPLQRDRFLREAQVLAHLTVDPDSDFPTLCEFGMHHEQPYLVREIVEGGTLEQLVNGGALGLRASVGILAAIARAVERVHGRGIAHRNLHPSNVLVSPTGTPRLIGFGRVESLAGTSESLPGISGVSAEDDVRALRGILGWLGEALDQPIPSPDSAGCPTAFAEALEGSLRVEEAGQSGREQTRLMS